MAASPKFGETGAVQALIFVPLDLAWINYLVTEEQRPSRASFPVVYRRPQLTHAPSTSAIKQVQGVMSRNR
jgi:hypothetical protein